MADLRIPPSSLPARTPAPVAPVRPQVAQAAQRAFFQAASGQPAPAVAPPAAAKTADSEPQRLPRPGSFLDIKV